MLAADSDDQASYVLVRGALNIRSKSTSKVIMTNLQKDEAVKILLKSAGLEATVS